MKATPVPLVSPMLPKTIATTFTAVPQVSGMLPARRRYVTARAPYQEENTALMAMRSCSERIVGKIAFGFLFDQFLES